MANKRLIDAKVVKTKTCGDCIHADICEKNPNLLLFDRRNEAFCVTFKDKADFVQVVRCKDCKHLVLTDDGKHNPCDCVCDYWMTDGLNDNDFCYYGERRTDG